MRFAAVVASLFATVRGQSISSCGGANDHLQNLKVVITPDPIEKGKSFTVDITGTMDEDLVGGTADVDLDVKVFSIIDQHVTSSGGFNFSPAIVPKGDAHVVVGPVTLPSIPLPGSITVSGKVALKNAAGEPILCLNLDLDVPAVEDRVLDQAPGVLADPVPTCTQDSDHMKNFVVEHDKDAHTTDLSGSLDEDVTSVTVKADLKVHLGFFPIPISVQAPVSFKPGLKKGDLKWHFSSDQEPPPPKVKVDGQVTLSDDKGEEIVCLKVLPPSDSEVIV